MPNPPLVLSVSYGDDEPSLSIDYMKRIDVEFQKAVRTAFTSFFALNQGRASVVSRRSEEHTSELQSLMRKSYAVYCLKKKTIQNANINQTKKTRKAKNK